MTEFLPQSHLSELVTTWEEFPTHNPEVSVYQRNRKEETTISRINHELILFEEAYKYNHLIYLS